MLSYSSNTLISHFLPGRHPETPDGDKLSLNKKSDRIKQSLFWSGRQDSNLRPPGPKPGALPACATSRIFF